MISYRRILRLALVTALLAGAFLVMLPRTVPWLERALNVTLGQKALAQLPTDRVPAPEFPKGFKWWNTDHPLSFGEDLKGQVVVLDFWTYCCINCIHNLANLAQVEEHYRDAPVAVIGVHSNKFTNESEAENIRQAILRYNIRHPVIVDQNMTIWQHYDVHSWPTMVFIDAQGQIVGSLSGERAPTQLISIIDMMLNEGRTKGVLAKAPLRLKREQMPLVSQGGLAFPGKIIAAPDGRLFISDSNHNRILVAKPEKADADVANVVQVIGMGTKGSRDGAADFAQFDNPQGLAFDASSNMLYVADTNNHLVRRVNLATGQVKAILGTGEQVYDKKGGEKGTAQGLNSPWDLALLGDTLYIAMAGQHQLWRMNLKNGLARAWVGSSAEGLWDGVGVQIQLAQPSGLTLFGDMLYFMDSETSSLREASLPGGQVKTLIGKGLFVFGDVDGDFDQARLQHPLGITHDENNLYIADTYNHKVKVVDPVARSILTLVGTGKAGTGDSGGQLRLSEPGGLAWSAGWLYIADTNNHRIVVLDPSSGAWSVLDLRFVKTEGALPS